MSATGTAISVCQWLMAGLGVFSWSLVAYGFWRAKTVRAQAGDLLLPPVRLAIAHPRMKAIAMISVTMLALAVIRESWDIVLLVLITFFGMSPFVLIGRSSWGPSYLELRQHGLIVGGSTLLGWSEVTSWRFQGTELIRLVLQTSDTRLDLPIHPDCRQSLEQALMYNLPPQVGR
jgi:hypothetical protein